MWSLKNRLSTALAQIPRQSGPRLAVVLLGLVILVWGVNWPVIKIGQTDMPPLHFLVARLSLGAATMMLLACALGRLRIPPRGDWTIVASVGVLQMAAYLGLAHLALQTVPAGRSAILAYTTSLWVVPGAMMFLGERPGIRTWGGFLLGLLGIGLLFNPFSFDWTDPTVLTANGLLLLAALLWATQILMARGHRWHATPFDLAPWQLLIGCLVALPFALAFESTSAIEWTPGLWAAVIYNGPFATAFCFWAVVSIARELPAITTSLAMLGVPATGLLASAIWLGEPLGIDNLGGLCAIAGGLCLVALDSARRQKA